MNKREIMTEAHRLWKGYKTGAVIASNSEFGFFLKCAHVLARLRPFQFRSNKDTKK